MAKVPVSADRLERPVDPNKPVNLREPQDFTPEGQERRERAVTEDVGETYRRMTARAERLRAGQVPRQTPAVAGAAADTPAARLRKSTEEYLIRSGQMSAADVGAPIPQLTGEANTREGMRKLADDLVQNANELLYAYQDDRRPQSVASRVRLNNFPYLQELREEAERQGINLSDDDIQNLVRWGQLNAAADAYIQYSQNGYEQYALNVLKTMAQDESPSGIIMATLLPTVIEQRALEAIGFDAKDPSTVDKMVEKLGAGAGAVFNALMVPGEEIREDIRAGMYRFGIWKNVGISWEEAEAAVQKGKYNENYIKQLVGDPGEGKWTQLEVDLAREVLKLYNEGNTNAVALAWSQHPSRQDPEVATFFGTLATGFGEEPERLNILMRQIQSVDLGSMAGLMNGAANPDLEYDPKRGDEWYSTARNLVDAGATLALDPINIIPIPLRLGQSARWSLTKLAPGAVDKFGNSIKAIDIIGKKSIGKLTFNTGASRYFGKFADDLNELDRLKKLAVESADKADRVKYLDEAAVLRQRMSRQYDEMPEELIESFRNHMPKNAEGKWDIDTIANFIDETNDAYIQAQGLIAKKFVDEGIQDQADLAAIQALLAERPIFAEAVAGTTMTRSLMVPRMSPVAALRKNLVNDVIGRAMPAQQARKILDEVFDEALTPAQIATRLDEKLVEVAKLMRENKGIGRWASSIPSGLVIPLANAAGAKEFYRFARQFMNRRTAAYLTDAYRQAGVGTRRLIIASTVRAGLASRGVNMTPRQIDNFISRASGEPVGPEFAKVTGSSSGEAYSIGVEGGMPSQKLAKFREQKAAMRLARGPEGVQERLAAVTAPTEQAPSFAGIARRIDENGDIQLSVDRNQFIESDPEMNRLFDEFEDVDVEAPDYMDKYNAIRQREAYLSELYDQELRLLEIDREMRSLPNYRRNAEGQIEAIYDEPDDALITQMANERYENLNLPGLATASEFERASGVFMTPNETRLFEDYGFLSESYLLRAFKHMESPERAAKINAPKLTKSQRENTPPNVEPNGGIEVFNFRLRKADVDGASDDYIYDTLRVGPEEVQTFGGVGDALGRLERFDPRRFRPESKMTEKSLQRQPRGIYVEWAVQSSKYGKPKFIEELKENVREELRFQFEEYVDPLLGKIPGLEASRNEIVDLLKAKLGEAVPPGQLAIVEDAIKQFDDNVAARLDGRRPFDTEPGDPILSIADDLERAELPAMWHPSRNDQGMEEAIHQYQIAKNIRVPSIQDIDEIRRTQMLAGAAFGKINDAVGAIVDGWSFGTLFGPRFSMRNAIEELFFYVLTGGKISDLYKGRRASTIQRTVEPRFVYEDVKIPGGTTEQRLVIKTNLGLINRLGKGYTLSGRLRDEMNQEWLMSIAGPISREDFLKAQLLAQAGDRTAYTRLFAYQLLSQRIPTTLTAREKDALLWISGSQAGQNFIRNVSETGNALLNGKLPSELAAYVNPEALAPGEIDAILREIPHLTPGMSRQQYGRLKPVKFDENNRLINGTWWWWREIQATALGDGPIGKLAIKYIGDPETAKKAIADVVRRDETWGYKEDWTMFADEANIDAAAARYYENVLRIFQKPSGEINWDLRNMLVDRIDGEDIVNWYRPRKPGNTPFDDYSDGEKLQRVSVQYLNGIPVKDRPDFVFGRLPGAPEPVPTLTGWQGIVTKGYGILGRQNARLSREPIYYANYINMVRQLEPLEENLAKSFAKAAGREEVLEIDSIMAKEFTNRTAADGAYSMTMAYVDNPANRSLLAWRVRNVARYYRATEDFWRRAKRLAVTRPEAYYRAALVYSVMDNTGFIFEDDNGEKYFYYPGNEYVQRAMGQVAALLPGVDTVSWDATNPFRVGGKVIGLTPSLDPKSWAPSFVGPMTFPIASAFHLFPGLRELSGLRSLILGPYAQEQPTLMSTFIDTVTPAGIKKLQQLDEDEFDSVIQQGAYDTVKIMIAEGLLDPEDLGATNGEISIADFMSSKKWAAAQNAAYGVTMTKMLGSYLLPAYPQAIEGGTILPAARELGIASVDTVFRQLLELNKNEPDPFGATVSMYYAAKIRKESGEETRYTPWDNLLPFTLSGSKNNPDKLAGLAGVAATDEFTKWFFSDDYNNYIGLDGAKESLYWLAPRQGEFTWQAWGLIKNQLGLKVSKTIEEQLQSLFAVQGQYRDTQIRKDFDEAIAQLDITDPGQRKLINQLNDQKSEVRKLNEYSNPYWYAARSESASGYTPAKLNNAVRQMEVFISSVEESGMKMPDTLRSIKDAITVWNDFGGAIRGLGQTKAELQLKAELMAQRDQMLAQISQADPNAERFIGTVLDTLNYGEYVKMNPNLMTEEVTE